MSTTPDAIALLPDDELPALVPRIPVRRPVIGLALAFGLGIGLGLESPGTPLVLLAVGGVFVLLAMLWRQHRCADFLLAACVVCLGWAHATLATHSPSGREVSALLARSAEYVTVIGEVQDAPTGQHDDRTRETIWTFPVRLEGLRRVTHWQRAEGLVTCQLRTTGKTQPPRFGERWLLTGLLGPHMCWRAGNEVAAGHRLTIDFNTSRRLAEARTSLYGLCLETRTFCADLLGRGLEGFPEQAGLLRAMLLGTREDMDNALFRDFSTTGTLHIIAVSGTHVAVIALLLLALLRAGGLTQPYWFFYLAPILIFYTMMTGLAPSAIRACIMALLFWIAPLLQRRPDGLLALAWSAILILGWDPTQGQDLGFMLSYAAVLGLLLLYPPGAARVHGWLRTDPWQLQAEPWLQRSARKIMRYTVLLALTSLAACLATAPLTAHYFNLISPVALLANLAVVPAAGLMMVLGCLALIGGAIGPLLAEIFNSANLLIITFITRCTEWSATLPNGHFFVRSPSWWVMASYYALLALILFGGRRLRQGGLAITALIIALLVWQNVTDDRLAVHVWRLGDATITLVNGPDKVLINTGPRFVARDLLRRIHAEGVNRLQALVLTRGTTAQNGGANEVLQQMPTRELWAAPDTVPSAIYLAAQRQNIPIQTLEAGQHFFRNGGTEWEVFHPNKQVHGRRAEDRALIFRVARGPLAMLFLNDASAQALANVLARPADPVAPIILADKIAALAPARLERFATREVITPFSAQRDLQTKQLELEQTGVRVWRLAEGDALHIHQTQWSKNPLIHGPSRAYPTTP